MNINKLTPYELAQKTVEDIAKRKQLEKDGQRQAFNHCMENRDKIQKRISRRRY